MVSERLAPGTLVWFPQTREVWGTAEVLRVAADGTVDLDTRGIRFWRDGDDLSVRVLPGGMSSEQADELRARVTRPRARKTERNAGGDAR